MRIIGYDIETTGLDPFSDSIVTHQCGDHVWESPQKKVIDTSETNQDALLDFLRDKEQKKIIHNAYFELSWIYKHFGIQIENFEDTKLMAKYLDISVEVTTGKHGKELVKSYRTMSLKPLYNKILGGDISAYNEINLLGGIDKVTRYLYLDEALPKKTSLPKEQIVALFKEYAIADNKMSEELYQYFISLPKWKEVRGIYELNKSALFDFVRMRIDGICVDRERVHAYQAKLTASLANVEQQLYAITGPFNYQSDTDAVDMLIKAGVPLSHTGKSGAFLTNKYTLGPLVDSYPVVDLFIKAKSLDHDIGFCDSILNKWAGNDGKVHPEIDIEGTKHGRLSCANPNMMNLKRDGELRSAFRAEPGYDVYFFDWAQQELVGLAYTMGIDSMLYRINSNIDLHRSFAPSIFNKPEDEITKDEREIAKTGNFQLGYMSGIEKFKQTLHEQAGVPKDEAKRLAPIVHAAFHKEYPQIKQNTYYIMKDILYSDEELQEMHDTFMRTREQQGLSTWAYRGRKYPYRGYLKNVFNRHIRPESPAKAYTCGELVVSGGFTGDMTKWKVRTISRYITKMNFDARIAMTVHDELIVHVKPKHARQLVPWIKQCMEYFPKVTQVVKMKCDVEKSPDGSWGKAGRISIYDAKKGVWNDEFADKQTGSNATKD